jgi:hypothetical protein
METGQLALGRKKAEENGRFPSISQPPGALEIVRRRPHVRNLCSAATLRPDNGGFQSFEGK